MHHTFARALSMATTGLALVCLLPVTASGEATLEEIKAVLKQRQERLEACTINWVEAQTYEPGSVIPPGSGEIFNLQGNAAKAGVPVSRTAHHVRRQFVIKGSMARYTAQRLMPDVSGRLDLADYVSTFDGKESRTLVSPTGRAPHGRVTLDTRNPDTPSLTLTPLLLALRPVDSRLCGVNLDFARIAKQSVKVNDIECVEVVYRNTHLWLDPARGYLVVQVEIREPQLRWSASLSYQTDSADLWMLDTWKIEDYGVSRTPRMQTFLAEVERYSVDAKLTEKDFRLEFPVGTSVYHEHDGKTVVIRAP